MQPSSSSRPRSRSWGAGPSSPTPRVELRHGRSRSATYSPLVSKSGLKEDEEQRAERKEETMEPQSDGEAANKEGAPPPPADERVRHLEREVAVAKHTEMKMLESLVHQTKELEQAKIALEEAKLEIVTLRQQQQQGAEPAAAQWSVMDLMFGGVDEEINGLRSKLRAAAQAEERSRKAADELTAALSAVTMEAKQVKAWLSDAQAELEAARGESERLESLLRAAEAELWSATERIGHLTSEWRESAAAWRAREKALLARARAAEEDAAEARRALGDENGALRRALERAVEEANAAGESLELATAENAGLKDALAEKERALDAARRENEALRASEAAARKELDDDRGLRQRRQLAVPSAARKATAADVVVGAGRKTTTTTTGLPLEKWAAAGEGKLSATAAFLDPAGRMMAAAGPRKDRMFASLSNLTELKSAAAAAAAMDDDYGYEFDHLDLDDVGRYGDPDHAAMKHKKRRSSILRKFGDLFRRRSLFYKSNLAPVLHHY